MKRQARDGQILWMVTTLNVAGALATAAEISHVLAAYRQDDGTASLLDALWTFELCISSTAFSRWGVRMGRSGAALAVAMLPLIAGIAMRVELCGAVR